ncbi:MAG: formate dehydrogenase accessory sulfurtransferase FdhD [Tepidimonas sp.]|uniref:formate dehydrogenase accessory sulfurtransferase FdhD n=1 Tax=Tepidimonas sp. TaxID=2002775 RepID=UPI00298EE7FE|nr:formate dehydrogenase accessory sulfurtransferase FdhD [Tepidimonas sp.]MCS6811380.1 formate dehydrogenase accessory sulfurtransferase FdhD [Tepidimonas sp.]MDW8335414.1 formate dehydrogenase accessory sulfurtransferase FdhD [Tepidimonas sp.]
MWMSEPASFGAPLPPAACPPRLSQAAAPLTRAVEVVNEFGQRRTLHIPAERSLTLYLDKHELVTLMTLGAHPEWLVLGYLRNQRLLSSPAQVESITVDWDVGAAAVRTQGGVSDWQTRTAQRIVTTGCGQGSVFGAVMEAVEQIQLDPSARLRQSQLYAILRKVRELDSVYKQAGSVHGCALFRGEELLLFVEDVGRHNAVDTIAGWSWLQAEEVLRGDDKVFYTTGRLTSEMILKAAQMGVPIVVSRSGITQMGLEVAERLGLCAIGRATHTRFLCYTHPQRLVWDTPLP